MAKKGKQRSAQKASEEQMLFSALNYKLIGLGLAFIFGGFIAMYVEHEIEGFVSLYVAPLLILFGFFEIIYAIMKVPEEMLSVTTKE